VIERGTPSGAFLLKSNGNGGSILKFGALDTTKYSLVQQGGGTGGPTTIVVRPKRVIAQFANNDDILEGTLYLNTSFSSAPQSNGSYVMNSSVITSSANVKH
jgi:hypothetical protein